MASTVVGEAVYEVKIDQGKLVVQLQKSDKAIEQLGDTASKSANKADKAFNSFAKGSLVAVGAGIAAIGVAIGSNLGGAIRRFDTLNNSARTFKNIGFAEGDVAASMAALNDAITGLPTALDDAVRGMTALASTYNSISIGEQLFTSLNNAILGFGGTAEDVNNAVRQLSQLPMDGPLDAQTWLSLRNSGLTPVLVAMSRDMGMSVDQMKTAFGEGKLTVADFTRTLLTMNEEGGGGLTALKDIAADATQGIGTGFSNMQISIQRGIATLLDAIGSTNITSALSAIGKAFQNVLSAVASFINFIRPIASALAPLTTGIGSAAASFVVMAGAVFAATKAMAALNVAMLIISRHPIVATLSLIAGLVAGIATAAGFDVMAGEADSAKNSTDELNKALADIEANVGSGSGAMNDMARQMAKISSEARKINEDYRYNLAQLVQSKNENIARLRETLDAEKKAYDNAYAERLAGFNKTQNKEQQSHAEKVKALQNQINFLTKYNNAANNKQVTELKFALAQENAEYRKSTALREAEFNAQTKSASEEYEKRRAENQKKLDEELALLEKHRKDVLSVRGVMLRDEIENLKEIRRQQLISLEERKQDAIRNARSTQQALKDILKPKAEQDGKEIGQAQAKGFRDGYAPVFKAISDANKEMVEANKKGDPKAAQKAYQNFLTAPLNIPGRFRGGSVSAGQPYLVGENRDGSINDTTELFIPKQSGAILPSNKLQSILSDSLSMGSNNPNINISINMSGVMASGKSDLRQVATQIGEMINETVLAKTGKKAIQGI